MISLEFLFVAGALVFALDAVHALTLLPLALRVGKSPVAASLARHAEPGTFVDLGVLEVAVLIRQ